MNDFSQEINYKTSRSGGKGGQNVNKVETAVEASWHVANSAFFSEEEKWRIAQKLTNKINADGFLQVKSTEHRTQLSNKETATKKLMELVRKSLIVPKKRKPTKIPPVVKEKRLQSKQRNAEVKQSRRKPNIND